MGPDQETPHEGWEELSRKEGLSSEGKLPSRGLVKGAPEGKRVYPTFEKTYTYRGNEVQASMEMMPHGAVLHVDTSGLKGKDKWTDDIAGQILDDYKGLYQLTATKPVMEGKKPYFYVDADEEEMLKEFNEQIDTWAEKGQEKLEKGAKKKGSEQEYLQETLLDQKSAWKNTVKWGSVGMGLSLAIHYGFPYLANFFSGGYNDVVDSLEEVYGDLSGLRTSLETVSDGVITTADAVGDGLDTMNEGLNVAYTNITDTINDIGDALAEVPVINAGVAGIRVSTNAIKDSAGFIKDSLDNIKAGVQDLTGYTSQMRDMAGAMESEATELEAEAYEELTVEYSGGDIDLHVLDANENGVLDYYEEGIQSQAEQIYNDVQNGWITDDEGKLIADSWEKRSIMANDALTKLARASQIGDMADGIDTVGQNINNNALAIYNAQTGTGYLADIEGEVSSIEGHATDIETAGQSIDSSLDSASTNATLAQEKVEGLQSSADELKSKLKEIYTHTDALEQHIYTVEMDAEKLNVGMTKLKNNVGHYGWMAGKTGLMLAAFYVLGVYAVPVAMAYRGYRTVKKANKQKKMAGLDILPTEEVFAKSSIMYKGVGEAA